jgi:molybdate transport system substrate-binding protein
MITLALAIGLGGLAACSKPQSNGAPRQLVVASASDMVNALPELGKGFEGRSGVKIVPTLGPSGALAQQIVSGAPFDIFLSADRRFVAQLVESKFLDPSSRRIYAIGQLALYSPKVRITEISELRLPEVHRFSIANPELAPYGRAAKQALERSGLWNDLQGKVVVAENIRQALEMVESGNVDVAMTAVSLVSEPSSAVVNQLPETLLVVPENLFDQIQQEAGIVTRSSGNPDAKAFLDYIASPDGQAILKKYGFVLPK